MGATWCIRGYCILALLTLAQPLPIASAQDSTTIVRLHRELATSELRISGTFGRVELLHSEIGPGGVSYYPGTALRLASPDSVSVAEMPTAPTWSDISRIATQVSVPVAQPVVLSELPPVLPWPDIRRIEKRGSATGRGALIGGGITLALALASIASNDCSGEGGAELCTVADAANILAIPVGAGIGALIGSASHRWKTVYRHP